MRSAFPITITADKILDWSVCILILLGVAVIGHKHAEGFLIGIVGQTLGAILMYRKQLPGLVVLNIAGICVNLYAYWKWVY